LPGRLWELITLSILKFETLKGLQFLVIDEADRMVRPYITAQLPQLTKSSSLLAIIARVD
jgi:superfamily II DNA/RNA helicase